MNRQPRRDHWVVNDLALGTQVDCIQLLGRPAKGFRWRDTSGTTSANITFHLNSLTRVRQPNETQADTIVQVWTASMTTAAVNIQFPSVTLTDGQSAGQGTGIYEGLEIRSLEVTAISATPPSGDCELEIW